MNRRNFIKKVGLLGAGYAINKNLGTYIQSDTCLKLITKSNN